MLEITLIGYGNQGKAWAANLRDSGWRVRVSGRPKEAGGSGLYAAARDGFEVVAAEKLREMGGKIALLQPDEAIPRFFEDYLTDALCRRSFFFAHGFSVMFGKIPFGENDEVILVAPKGIGQKLRESYQAGSGVMAVLGVHRDVSGSAWEKARAVARGLGCLRVGAIDSSFKEECFADLLSEQVVLCGLVPMLVQKSIEFLVQKGVDPRLARYECLNELKLITDMMVEHGIKGMFERVSRTAHLGGLLAQQSILPKQDLRDKMETLWRAIEDGSFAAQLETERKNSYPRLNEHLLEIAQSSASAKVKDEEKSNECSPRV